MTLRPLLQLALAAVLISPIAAHAQADTSLGTAIRGIDRVIRIRSHPSLGLTLDAGTRPGPMPSQPRRVRGHFDPAQMVAWLDDGLAAVAPSGAPADLYALQQTAPFGSATGDTIRLSRRSLGNAWDSTVVLRIVAVEGGSLDLPLGAAELAAFAEGIRRHARTSGFSADSVLAKHAARRADRDRGAGTPPMLTSPGRPRWPRGTPRGQVVVEFILGTDGVPDPASFDLLWADDDALILPAFENLKRMSFTPGTVDGRPARTRIRQVLRH